MQYVLLIYETADAFARRQNEHENEPYMGAWRSYYKSIVDAGIYLGGQPLDIPETGTTVAHPGGKRQIQDGPTPTPRSSSAGSCCSSCHRSMPRLNGLRAARPPPAALWRYVHSHPGYISA